MGCLGNIIWFIFGGCITALTWFFTGLFWSITIAGIPVGLQCFKMAHLSLFPFGKDVVYVGGTFSRLANILWLIFGGLALAAEYGFFGCIYCITIIGIPFGKQCFKMAKLALMPIGAKVI